MVKVSKPERTIRFKVIFEVDKEKLGKVLQDGPPETAGGYIDVFTGELGWLEESGIYPVHIEQLEDDEEVSNG